MAWDKNYSQKPQNRQNSQNTAPQINLPEIKLDYKENPSLFDTTAKQTAKIVNTSQNQMRNFYDYLLKYYEKSQNSDDFSEILPFVKMLNSKVAYANSRKHATNEFKEMIERCVAQVNDKKSLECFKLFFEAVLGFSKK
ncbi:type III-A CRISPR-associated protein Csm2 [Campylobacter sp. JMF_01 NE2]|uniref:type III-A CRISPR-associated protein Csm2 n=1 Tax=unclassified Campylobacter TaxID=2593542 RepID=UPI0022E99A39|nr:MULTISPECIES: type III-A CRISPR-associated protein Csm2 [unclassified Campylobacter]MDA3052864.1 type III-A CRISPR-associated protein Csm2 [Campylobacter sp. JMF_03 NE3]MDA3067195.1 type III-A CRISPR-associated protein Csm2 [Campylobacter sp. JMF_01 NE2]